MKARAAVIAAVLLVAGCLASYRLGLNAAKVSSSDALTAAQAMLAFNHLQRYEELHSCLENGRVAETKEKLRHSATSERELLAELLQVIDKEHVTNYIELRSGQSVEAFRTYKSGRGSTWSEPPCA